MDSLQQRLESERSLATRELREAEAQLAAAQQRVATANAVIKSINRILGNEHAAVDTTVLTDAPGGKTAKKILEVLVEAGKKLSLEEIVSGVIARGLGSEDERTRLKNNVSSVLYRSIARSGMFKKVGRGEFDLTTRA